jgi:hypothetical protein
MKKNNAFLLSLILLINAACFAQQVNNIKFDFVNCKSDTLTLGYFNKYLSEKKLSDPILVVEQGVEVKSFLLTVFKDGELSEHFNSTNELSEDSIAYLKKVFESGSNYSNLHIEAKALQLGQLIELKDRNYVLSKKK